VLWPLLQGGSAFSFIVTAARLEGLTKEAGVPVLISAETVARLHGPVLRELPVMRLRGKDEAMRVFTLP